MSRLERHRPLSDHVVDVLDQLDVDREGFEAVSRAHGGTQQIVAYVHSGYPGFSLSGDITEQQGRYRLELDFDLYMLHSDARQDT